MKQVGSVALFQYWNRLRGPRAAPRRTEIEPADIKTLLADTFILERDARGEPVFRLAGTRLCATYGRELKGFSFPSLWRAKDQPLVARLAGNVFDDNAVVVVTFEGISTNQRTNGFELIVLPLDGGAENPRALGAVSPCDKPFWLGADPVVECTVDTLRVVDPEREPMFLKNRPAVPVPSLEPAADGIFGPMMNSGGRRFRHLVVIDGGRDE